MARAGVHAYFVAAPQVNFEDEVLCSLVSRSNLPYDLRFNADEKDMLQSIQALGNAVTVLSKHHESFLQTTADSKEVLKPNLCFYVL